MHRHVCVSRLLLLSLAAAVTLSPSAGSACGYHDDVSMARGLLNWVYPDALHVLGAISTAVAERRLPPPDPGVTAPDLFGSRYRKAIRSLAQLGDGLNDTAGDIRPTPISLVLIEPLLWTRFEASGGTLRPRMHVTGPEPGDLVLVSGEAVVGEIARGRLTIGEAHRLGLIRLYGPSVQQERFLLAYERVGRQPLAGKAASQARPQQIRAPVGSEVTVKGGTFQFAVSDKAGELMCGPGHH